MANCQICNQPVEDPEADFLDRASHSWCGMLLRRAERDRAGAADTPPNWKSVRW